MFVFGPLQEAYKFCEKAKILASFYAQTANICFNVRKYEKNDFVASLVLILLAAYSKGFLFCYVNTRGIL